jgi:hypothetical protein
LYTDFSARAQFLFVPVEHLVDVHARGLIEMHGAGQALGIDAEPDLALAFLYQ